jgi:hypothetical protein
MMRGTIALFACTIFSWIGVPARASQTYAHSDSIMPRFSRPSHGFAGLSHGSAIDWIVGRSAIDWIVGTLFVAALMPLALIDIVPMTDYLNHLARIHLLAAAGTPDANPYYDITWKLYPNLAADLLVPQLARLMSVEAALRLFFGFSQFLVVTGAIAIERQIRGRHLVAGLAALLVLFNVAFNAGLLNFEFAVGVALWAIAIWIKLRDAAWPRRLLAHALFVGILFLSHFFALGIYGLTIGLFELTALTHRKWDPRRTAGLLAVMAGPVLVLLGVMHVSGGAVGGQAILWDWRLKLLWPLNFLNGYIALCSVFVLAVLIVLIGFLRWKDAIALSAAGRWIAAGFALTYIAMPRLLFNTDAVDVRVLVGAALIVPAFVTIRNHGHRYKTVALICVAALISFNLVIVQSVWFSYRDDYREMQASFRTLTPNAHVVAALGDADSGFNALLHPIQFAPTLAAYARHAFIPQLATFPGMQPLTGAASVRRLMITDGMQLRLSPFSLLKDIAEGRIGDGDPAFLKTWAADYDYLYLSGPHTPNPLPRLLTEMVTAERFTLYKIRHDSPDPAMPGDKAAAR